MFQILYYLIRAIQPILVPACFFFAWMLMILVSWNTWAAIANGVTNVKRMHRIPCAGCQYFTGDYRLKCTVQPNIALSEDAINCRDYLPTNSIYTASGERA